MLAQGGAGRLAGGGGGEQEMLAADTQEHARRLGHRLPPATTVDQLPEVVRTAVASVDGGRVLVHASSLVAALGPLIRWAETCGTDLPDLDVRRPSLEDVYLALTDTKTDTRR
jgi:ABC-2 type transport system ATP-binding protein